MKFFLEFLAGLLSALFAGVIIAWLFSLYYPTVRNGVIDRKREEIHGVWLLEEVTEAAILENYIGLRTVWLVSLSADEALNISGYAQLLKESGRNGEIDYPRETRIKSDISGSVVKNDLLLNVKSKNRDGLESMQALQGVIHDTGMTRGYYFSDVAYQIGTYCAEKLTTEDLINFDVLKIQGNFCVQPQREQLKIENLFKPFDKLRMK